MPGSNNFLQWNPAAVNQQDDSAYTADAMRTGGAVTGIFPSDLANKLFYQCTTMVAAFGEALSNKGYTVSDTNIATLITLLANVLTKADFGTTAGTVCEGNDSRLSDERTPVNAFSIATATITAMIGNSSTATKLKTARTINGVSFDGSANITITANPNSHTHGNITNTGYIGTTAKLPIITGTGGILQAGSFGSSSGTFCEGNDLRLSDNRTPVSHAVNASTYGYGDGTNAGHLRVGTGLTSNAGTVSVTYGTTAGTSCQGNDSRFIPAGTKMWFYQNIAPTGWTIDSTPADAVLAVKGGSAAYNASGGTQAGTWTQPNHLHTTGSHTLTIEEMPSHSHIVYGWTNNPSSGGGSVGQGPTNSSVTSNVTGGNGSHNHGNTGNAATANTWRPLAQLGIICTKN